MIQQQPVFLASITSPCPGEPGVAQRSELLQLPHLPVAPDHHPRQLGKVRREASGETALTPRLCSSLSLEALWPQTPAIRVPV